MDPLAQDIWRQTVLALALVIPAWRICRRAGVPPALSLVVFAPYVGYFALSLILAFRPWPAAERN